MKYPIYQNSKYSDISWLSSMPQHWEVKKFRFLFTFGRGLGITKSDLQDEGIPCINYGEIHSKYGFEVIPEKHELKCVSESYLETSRDSLLKEGDFVFADTSEDIEGSGNFSYLNSKTPTFAGYHIVITRLQTDDHPRYLAYLIGSLPFRYQIRKSVSGVKVFSITQDILKSCHVWLPPIDEQKKIVAFLDYKTQQIDQLIKKKKSLIEKLNEQHIAVITQAVSKGLDKNTRMKSSGVEWLGDVPEHWEMSRLKFFIQSLDSGVSVNADQVPATNNDPGVLKTSCVYGNQFRPAQNKRIYDSELERAACPVVGDSIIISRMNTPELVGHCGYVEKDYLNLFLPDRLWITRFEEEFEGSVKYFWYLLSSKGVQAMTEFLATGASPSMKNLTQPDYLSIKIVAPDSKEQHSIVLYLDAKLKRIKALSSKAQKVIVHLIEYREALITSAVTGKIDIRKFEID